MGNYSVAAGEIVVLLKPCGDKEKVMHFLHHAMVERHHGIFKRLVRDLSSNSRSATFLVILSLDKLFKVGDC